jgi:hypothetical protein
MLLSLLMSCTLGSAPLPPGPAAPPDIVLVAVNGLRADVGEPRAEAGFLDALATPVSARFSSAYAQSGRPHTSLGAAVTGRYPSGIPLCSPPATARPDGARPWCVDIPTQVPTLPEVLSLYGYTTALITVNEPALGVRGVGQTFAVTGGRDPEGVWPEAAQTAREWWTGAADTPRLLIVVGKLNSTDLEAKGLEAYAKDAMGEEERDVFRREHPELAARLRPEMRWPIATDAAVEEVRRAYVDAAGRVGAQVGALLQSLPATDARARWGVVTSLHGMSLGEFSGTPSPEQARAGTHLVLLDRTLRVPVALLAPDPPVRPTVIDTPTELVDLVPTLVALAGAVPPAGLAGRDLLSPATAQERAYAEFGDMLMVREGDLMLSFRSEIHGVTSIDPRMTERLRGSVPPDLPGYAPTPLRPPPRASEGPPLLGQGGSYPEFRMHDVAADPMQATPLPVQGDDARFRQRAATLLQIRSGPALPPAELMGWERVQALRDAGALHYW